MTKVMAQASIFNLPPKTVLRGGADEIEFFLAQCGYQGLQYAAGRTSPRERDWELAKDRAITSLHQSWAHGLRPADLAFRAALYGVRSSVPRLIAIQNSLPQRVPTVVHPNDQFLGNREPTWKPIDYPRLQASGRLGPLLEQPTVEVLYGLGLVRLDLRGGVAEEAAREAADFFVAEQASRGFDGMAVDGGHLYAERNGKRLSPEWVFAFAGRLAAIGALGGPSEYQVSIRPDFGGNQGDVANLMAGRFDQTFAGQLLGVIKDNLPPDQEALRVTTEARSYIFDGFGGYVEGNTVLRESISQTMGS